MNTQTVLDVESRVAVDAVLGLEPITATTAMVESPALEVVVADSPMAQALQALKAGLTLADMRDILEMQRVHNAEEARKAFVSDMVQFKLNPPEILKDKHVYFETSKGVTSYDHATIGNVCKAIIAAAAAHGFSHRWVPGATDDGQLLVTTVITHRLGHSEKTTLRAGADASGGKNEIQAIASANTYMQRHGVLMAFGFATEDAPDDDGRAWELMPDAATDPLQRTRGQVAAPAVAAEAHVDKSETKLTRYWCDMASKALTPLALRATKREANKGFREANDLPRWNAWKQWCDEQIAAMVARQEK